MARQKFDLKSAEEIRRTLTKKQEKQIYQLYLDMYKDVSKKLKKIGKYSKLEKVQLIMLKREIEQQIKQIDKELKTGIKNSVRDTSRVVVEDTRKFLSKCGFKDIEQAFYYVPDTIVKRIVSGDVYKGDWTLSKAIWGHTRDFNIKLERIIANGTKYGKSAYEIARDLEQYVNPQQIKKSKVIKFKQYKRDSKGKFVLDKDGNRIPEGRQKTFYFGNVDYNAQRLARTMISHAYQQSFEMVNKNDPFVKGYIWHSSGQHGRTCQLCLSRDGRLFQKDELPLDHPNGMCTFEAYIPDDMSTIADKIGKWYSSPVGTYPDIDKYALDFMGE